mmetsp:Transcript_29382/g.60955  ORF Transcript_29382/g.60955 Transcript_29382/m.60955 type:complete len:301 (+) Transcript_29382:444-1346(+)
MVVSLRNMPLAIFFCLLVLAYSPCWAHPNVQSCFLAGASSSDPLGHSRRAANTMAFDSVATSLGRMQLIPPTRSINLMSKQKQKSNSQNSYSNFNPQFMMAKKSNIPEYFTRNNKNDQDGDANGDSLKTSKKGVFRRVRDRIANTFAGTNNNNDNNKQMKQKQKGQGSICYKCGSTEHRIQICPKIKKYLKTGQTKVDFSKVGELPFASCYVCQKMGHLASSCPESRNGVFPMGGSCRECGSVDHFAANCPNKEKGDQSNDDESDSNSVTIDQFLDETDKPGRKEDYIKSEKKKRRVVNF